ncbi:MAG: zinc ribbon domain-containing protein [Novosphingobium sp.]
MQAKLKDKACGTSRRLKSQQPSLLVGLMFDGEGRAMTPSHSTKVGRRYRYYVTRTDQLGDAPAGRVSAHDLEWLVCDRLSDLLMDKQLICDLANGNPADVIQRSLAEADVAAATLRSGPAHSRAELLVGMISRIDLHEAGIDLTVNKMSLSAALKIEPTTEMANRSIMLNLPATKARRGHQLRLVIPGPQVISIAEATRDNKLIALMAEAHRAKQLILANPEQSIAAIASQHGRCRTRLGKLAALGCLAPDIVTAIVEGRQPATLNVSTLQDIALPLVWADQRALLGFA